MCRSLFLIKLQVSILQLYKKEKTPIQAFSDEFCEIFERKNNVQQQKNVLISLKKNTLKKGGKLETTGKNDTRSKKLKALLTSSLHILALLKNSFSPLFSASDDTLKARFFKKTMQSN